MDVRLHKVIWSLYRVSRLGGFLHLKTINVLIHLSLQIGPNGYYFAIDPNGYVLLHPNLQPKVSSLYFMGLEMLYYISVYAINLYSSCKNLQISRWCLLLSNYFVFSLTWN